MGRPRMSESEMEIMEFIWSQDGAVRIGEICKYLGEVLGKTWKQQTIRVFLSRLQEKGYLNSYIDPESKKYVFVPTQPREQFLRDESEKIVNRLFKGSIYDFVVAFSGGKHINEDEAEKLKKLLKD